MNIEKILKDHINTLYSKLSPSFISIYYQEKPLFTKTILSEKKKRLEETLGLIIYKGHQINEIIPDFGEEYIYTEGEDIQIYICFVTPDISIVTLSEHKIKFSLLKLEHEIVARDLRKYVPQIRSFAEGSGDESKNVESTQVSEGTVLEDTKESETERKVIKEEESYDKIEEYTEDIEELEKVLSDNIEEKSDYEKEIEALKDQEIVEDNVPSLEELLVDEKIEESIEDLTEEEPPSLEEILTGDKEDIIQEEGSYLDASVLDKVYKNLAKEMGPVARIIFNQKVRELKIDREKLSSSQVKKLISELAQEIMVDRRRERFIKNCNNLI
ncbi:hypothetical protein [Persephonella sp.]